MSQEGEATIWSSAKMGWQLYSFIQSWGQAWNSSVVGDSYPIQGIFNEAYAYLFSFIMQLVIHHDDVM